MEGTVSIDKQTIEGTPETLALVDRKPRSATAKAVGPVEVLAFGQTALDQFFIDSPAIHLKIVENLVQITSGRLRFSDETLVQAAYDIVIEIDASFRILKHNRITERSALIPPETPVDEVVGSLLFDVLSRLGEGVRQQVTRICTSGEPSSMSLEYESADGGIGFYELTVAPESRIDETVSVAIGIRNVTETKALETRLINTEKLAMTGQMAAEIGHELRNYLTVLIGHVDLMGVNPDVSKSDKAVRSLGIMGEQLTRIENFATGLMELGVLKLKMEPSDVNVLVEKLIDFFRGQKRFRRVAFEFDLGEQLPQLEADQGQIHQILMNLYANAADAMDAGVIKTTTRAEKEGSLLVVEVAATGPGIPDEQLEKIFESGYTTKDTGHGFSLAVCRRIIENHHGEIEVTSVIGKGTTFRLTFRLTE